MSHDWSQQKNHEFKVKLLNHSKTTVTLHALLLHAICNPKFTVHFFHEHLQGGLLVSTLPVDFPSRSNGQPLLCLPCASQQKAKLL